MIFIMGIDTGRKDFPYEKGMRCPSCGSYGRYIVYMTYTCLSLFFIPLFKWNRKYYVETSCCHRTYELDDDIGRRISRGEDVEIQPRDLTEIAGVNYGASSEEKICTVCGYTTKEDFGFCPRCGNKSWRYK